MIIEVIPEEVIFFAESHKKCKGLCVSVHLSHCKDKSQRWTGRTSKKASQVNQEGNIKHNTVLTVSYITKCDLSLDTGLFNMLDEHELGDMLPGLREVRVGKGFDIYFSLSFEKRFVKERRYRGDQKKLKGGEARWEGTKQSMEVHSGEKLVCCILM